jgi:hypothetical protein
LGLPVAALAAVGPAAPGQDERLDRLAGSQGLAFPQSHNEMRSRIGSITRRVWCVRGVCGVYGV